MKKSSYRVVLLSFLVAMSIAATLFLHTVATKLPAIAEQKMAFQQSDFGQVEPNKKAMKILEVELGKTVFEVIKKIMPASAH